MVRKIRFFLILMALGSLGFLATLTWLKLRPEGESKQLLAPPTSPADLQLNRVKYTETREGIKEWELEAFSVGYFQEENIVFFEKIKATFFGKNKVFYRLVGERGKLHIQTKTIEVFGGVEIDSSDGYHLRTRSLQYLAEKKELITSDQVEMRSPQFSINGEGMVVDLDRQRVKILSQVKTTFLSGNKTRDKEWARIDF